MIFEHVWETVVVVNTHCRAQASCQQKKLLFAKKHLRSVKAGSYFATVYLYINQNASASTANI